MSLPVVGKCTKENSLAGVESFLFFSFIFLCIAAPRDMHIPNVMRINPPIIKITNPNPETKIFFYENKLLINKYFVRLTRVFLNRNQSVPVSQ